MADSNTTVLRLLAEQRKRCLATILTSAEAAPWWGTLSSAQQATFREQVRSALNVFYELTRDVVKVSDNDDLQRNDIALDLIRSIHTQQVKITQALGK